jgi:hypothetical protein
MLVFALSTGVVEAYWRSQGCRPTVQDSKDLWYFWRQSAYRADGKVIVFLGTSRIVADVSLDSVRKSLPDYRVVQLGLGGAESCIGLLRDFADDSAFRGIVVCELETPLLDRTQWERHSDFRVYQPRSLAAHFDTIAAALIAGQLVAVSQRVTIKATILRILRGASKSPADSVRMGFSREVQWDFAKVRNIEDLRQATTKDYVGKYTAHKFPSWEALRSSVIEINVFVQRIRNRGGEVIFLRAPSSGQRWRLEERYHPRFGNWDHFAKLTIGLCIHFRDFESLPSLTCPDESHLSQDDSPRFTRMLVEQMRRHDVFR